MPEGPSLDFFLKGRYFFYAPQRKKRASDRHRRPVLTSETTKRKNSKYFSLIAYSLVTFPPLEKGQLRYYAFLLRYMIYSGIFRVVGHYNKMINFRVRSGGSITNGYAYLRSFKKGNDGITIRTGDIYQAK